MHQLTNQKKQRQQFVLLSLSLIFLFVGNFLVPELVASDKRSSPYVLEDAQFQRAMQLFGRVRCLECAGQSIKDSNTDTAITIKNMIWEALAQGKTDQEIEQLLLQRYGKSVLDSLPFDRFTYILLFFPILMFGGFIIFIWRRLTLAP